MMRRSGFYSLMRSVILTGIVLALVACNTTKATIDTTEKFFSSTSPDSMFTADGMVERDAKVYLFAGVAFDNLRQEVAQGEGQYVTSLAVLMNIPPDEREKFARVLQARHSTLFTSELDQNHTAHLEFVEALKRELKEPGR